MKIVLPWIALLPLLAAQTGGAKWHQGVKIAPGQIAGEPNGSAFGAYVHFAGQPSADDLRAAAAKGVKMVINLRMPGEMASVSFDEKAIVEAAGMKYIHTPMGGQPPAAAELEKVLAALDKADKEPVLLHCASAVRSGFIWSLFRSRRHGLTVEEAVAEGKSAGMRSAGMEKTLRDTLATK